MFNRYSIVQDPGKLIDRSSEWQPIYNAFPTLKLPILHSGNELSLFHWGRMAKWSNNKPMSPKLHNVSAQGITQKASTKTAIKTKRCVALADGYYVWRPLGKKKMTPYYHFMDQRSLFGIAGIWESSEDLDGNPFECFLCLVESIEGIEQIIIIHPDDFEAWLDPNLSVEEIEKLIAKSKKQRVDSHPVSPAISNPKLNTPQLIQPSLQTDQHGNYTLF